MTEVSAARRRRTKLHLHQLFGDQSQQESRRWYAPECFEGRNDKVRNDQFSLNSLWVNLIDFCPSDIDGKDSWKLRFVAVLAFSAIGFVLGSQVIFQAGHSVRARTDMELEKMPILILSLQRRPNQPHDIGGWMTDTASYRNRYLLRNNLPYFTNENVTADFGGILFVSSKLTTRFQREIDENDYQLSEFLTERTLASDKDTRYSKRYWHDDELEDIQEDCRRPSWELLQYPNCHVFHELDLSRHFDYVLAKRAGDRQGEDAYYLSHGYYRDVFGVSFPSRDEKAVLKLARYERANIDYRTLLNAHRDALVMERLSAADNIVDIFGYCGSSVLVESLPVEVEEVIVPGDGYIAQEDLHDKIQLKPRNHYNATEKLEIALAMAKSIAELHGFEDGVIVHNDIQLCQWLRTDQGKLKLGDFNRATLRAWNVKENRYCKHNNGACFGNYRAPEENAKRDLDEKIDVWSFGNNIYALLTGLWVFYDNEDDQMVQGLVINKTLAYVDPRYRTRSFAERKLVEIMEKCWIYEPEKRLDIFQVVEMLQNAWNENQKQQS